VKHGRAYWKKHGLCRQCGAFSYGRSRCTGCRAICRAEWAKKRAADVAARPAKACPTCGRTVPVYNKNGGRPQVFCGRPCNEQYRANQRPQHQPPRVPPFPSIYISFCCVCSGVFARRSRTCNQKTCGRICRNQLQSQVLRGKRYRPHEGPRADRKDKVLLNCLLCGKQERHTGRWRFCRPCKKRIEDGCYPYLASWPSREAMTTTERELLETARVLRNLNQEAFTYVRNSQSHEATIVSGNSCGSVRTSASLTRRSDQSR